MLNALSQLTKKIPDGTKVAPPIPDRDWAEALDKLQADVSRSEAAYEAAKRYYADACLLAHEGAESEAQAKEKAFKDMEAAHQAHEDAKAAYQSAERRKTLSDSKAKHEAEARHQDELAAGFRRLVVAADKVDGAMDDLVEAIQGLIVEVNDVRRLGFRSADQPLRNLNRSLASRARGMNIDLGANAHVFDGEPKRLIELCPDLRGAIKEAEGRTNG